MVWRERFRRIHRWMSLALVAVWIIQAVSGVFLVFHRDIDDAVTRRATQALDIARLARQIGRLEMASDTTAVTSVFLTSPLGRHYDVMLEDDTGPAAMVRLDGAGAELLRRAPDEGVGAVILAMNRVHRSLAAGERGAWLVRLSGLFLLTNLVLGLRLAWPARGQWGSALKASARCQSNFARSFNLHRALGLWLVVPALVVMSCGTLLAFERTVLHAIGATASQRPTFDNGNAPHLGLEKILAAGIEAAPGESLTGILFPMAPGAPYQLRFLGSAELPQTHGETRVYVDPTSAAVLSRDDPRHAPSAKRFMQALFPIHTGQAGGWLGRGLVMMVGLWLLAMPCLGVRLWWSRHMKSRPNDRMPTQTLLSEQTTP
jgi:uncharacterized iron-regulated membrane protein